MNYNMQCKIVLTDYDLLRTSLISSSRYLSSQLVKTPDSPNDFDEHESKRKALLVKLQNIISKMPMQIYAPYPMPYDLRLPVINTSDYSIVDKEILEINKSASLYEADAKVANKYFADAHPTFSTELFQLFMPLILSCALAFALSIFIVEYKRTKD